MTTSFGKKSHHLHLSDYEADMFTGITTYHGLVRIYNSAHWISRWFWITVVFTSFSLFLLQAYQLLLMLDSKPTLTQINFNVPNDGLDFPFITICNFNPTMKSKMAKYNLTEDVEEYIQTAYTEVETLDEYYENETRIHYLHEKYIEFVANYNAMHPNDSWRLEKFFVDVGYNCEDMLLECSYGGKNISCCDYVSDVMTDIGKCFRFGGTNTTKKLQKQVISGSAYGLHILIDVRKNESTEIDLLNYMDNGIKFYVHPRGILPILSSAGSAVAPGKKAYSAVSIRTLQLLPEDQWGVCQSDWNGNPNDVVVHPNKYSNQNCEQNCIAAQFNKTCGCVPLKYQYNSNLIVCDPAVLYNCTKDKHFIDSEDYWYTACNCSIECDRIEYSVAVSYSAIPNDIKLIEHYNQSASYVQENYLALAIYFKEIAYESHQQQKSIDRISVLSNIGGSMGLFLGMSLITLGEIFIFIFKLIWGLTHRRRKNEIESRYHVGDHSKSQTTNESNSNEEIQMTGKYSEFDNAGGSFAQTDSSTATPNPPNPYTYQKKFDPVETETVRKNIFKRLFKRQR